MATRYELPGVGAEDEGIFLGQATMIDFAGAGVTAVLSSNLLTVTIPGGGGGVSDHSLLTNLAWGNSGHIGLTTAVAAWQANASTPVVVQASSDETMLVRRAGVLQWVPIAVAALSFSGMTGAIPGNLPLGTVTVTAGVFS